MSKPLWGGGAACVALLSASLLFYAQPSVVTLAAVASHALEQKGDAETDENPAADASAAFDRAETSDKETPNVAAATPDKPKAESTASEAEKEDESSSQTLSFTATAYSLRGRTASGLPVARGFIAADRRLLPIGTRVRLEAGSYSGEYTVADTGGAVRGRKIDIWVPSTGEAMRFGRRPVKLTVLSRTRSARR